MIGLLSSVSEEGTLVIRQLKKYNEGVAPHVFPHPHLPAFSGELQGKDVVYMLSGMGKSNAAFATTVLMERFSPDLIILFGVGGAYPSRGLRVGDVATAEKEIYGDEGVLTSEGFQGTEFIGIPLAKKGSKKYFNEFPLDKKLTALALEKCKRFARGSSHTFAVRSGTFVTVSTCSGTRQRAKELENRFGAICENMEGAAVAHVSAFYMTPVIEVRGISNIVGDRDRSKWNIRLAAENCQRVLIELLRAL